MSALTSYIGLVCGKIIDLIVRALALSRIHPNVLTFLGLLINIWRRSVRRRTFSGCGAGADRRRPVRYVDGRVARETNRVTRFGGFFDSVLDRYSDLALLMGCWSTMLTSTVSSTLC